jgi:hypothetical protein
VKQEERHVQFGEERTVRALRDRPALRRRLLGLSLVSMWAVRRLAGFLRSRQRSHEVLAQLPEFLRFSLECAEKRLLRRGVLARPLAQTSALEKGLAVAEAYGTSLATAPFRFLPRKRLTETYLQDPAIRSALQPPRLHAVR